MEQKIHLHRSARLLCDVTSNSISRLQQGYARDCDLYLPESKFFSREFEALLEDACGPNVTFS